MNSGSPDIGDSLPLQDFENFEINSYILLYLHVASSNYLKLISLAKYKDQPQLHSKYSPRTSRRSQLCVKQALPSFVIKIT